MRASDLGKLAADIQQFMEARGVLCFIRMRVGFVCVLCVYG